MDPATAAALASAAASLGGSFLQNKAGEKAAEQSAAQRAQEIDLIKSYGSRAQESILPAYQGAQDVRQQDGGGAWGGRWLPGRGGGWALWF